ncbi:MAG: histidine ammonia-lyase [Rhodobacteraceae bacterium]|nr:histidine ammonia-lyase [Paracoccaceae bacterium]
MNVLLIGGNMRLNEMESIYRGASPQLDPEARDRVMRSRAAVVEAAASEEPVYGINTGFGKLASLRIRKEETDELQRNLVLSHCAGIGDPLPEPVVRLALALKINGLARGASGVRWEIITLLEAMLKRGVLPRIPEKGSVGASGDLAPLAHIAAVMIGEGRAIHRGKVLDGAAALRSAGLQPVQLAAKEGLAMLNGTQVSTALALAGLFDAWRGLATSLTTGALSTEAAMGSPQPFRSEIHELRGHRGQLDVSRTLRQLLAGSEIRESHRIEDERVQDPYSLRCQPQVAGAALDVLRQAAGTLAIEGNAVTDNPLVLADGALVSGGNFHGEPVGFAADQIAMAIAETGSIAQRRIALLVDPALSNGLPAFLSPNPGLNSGFMILDIVSAALVSENKALANPRVIDSLPTSAHQEDHVAMSCHAARRLLEMTDNLFHLVAIEALCAAQGVEFRVPLKTGTALTAHMTTIRESVPRLGHDRALDGDIRAVTELVRNGSLVAEGAPGLEVT